MNSKKPNKLRILLYPLSVLYGLIIRIRHKLFDWNIIQSKKFDIPIICIGNITVGGTGKTPHTEYLIELLNNDFNMAVLSRGYKRKTKGYVEANEKASPITIGDEPFQIFNKYPTIKLSVCEKRVDGVNQLLRSHPDLNAILLDDAFQHRKIKPGFNIVLIDYNRPLHTDFLLPSGNLRDTKSQIKRADIILVTKTPKNISDIEKRLWIKQVHLYPYQKMFFTTIDYQDMEPVFSGKHKAINLQELRNKRQNVLLVSGIANPKPFKMFFHDLRINYQLLSFPDHHNFSEKDILEIEKHFQQIENSNKLIITTEKDAVRLREMKFSENLKDKLYYLPIKVSFADKGNTEFDKIIIDYVGKNKKIGRIHS